jgi:hypothetical protein
MCTGLGLVAGVADARVGYRALKVWFSGPMGERPSTVCEVGVWAVHGVRIRRARVAGVNTSLETTGTCIVRRRGTAEGGTQASGCRMPASFDLGGRRTLVGSRQSAGATGLLHGVLRSYACGRGRPGYTASFSRAWPDMCGGLGVGLVVGGQTMRMFQSNLDFRASVYGRWSPTHGEARTPGHACLWSPLPPSCTAPIPYPTCFVFCSVIQSCSKSTFVRSPP